MPSGKLPPYPPADPEKISKVIGLLSKVQHNKLLGTTHFAVSELERIVGAAPSSYEEIKRWKVGLKALRREVLKDPDQEAEGE